MNLPRYLISKFTYFFVLCSGTLTVLVTLVEFFEKIGRVQGSIGQLLTYSALSLLPHFFTLIALGSWLAVGLLLWDCHLHHRWEALHLLGISPKTCVRMLAYAAIALSLGSFCVKELVLGNLETVATTYKQTHLKQAPTHTLVDEWLAIGENKFMHVDKLDLSLGSGLGITLISCTDSFGEFTHTHAQHGTLRDGVLTLSKGTITEGFSGTRTFNDTRSYTLPGLNAALSLKQPAASTLGELYTLLLARRRLGGGALHAAFTRTFAALLSHLRPGLVMLLTLIFFFLLQSLGFAPWIALGVYPVFAGLASFVEFGVAHGSPLLFLFLPYVLGYFLMRFGFNRLA